MNHLTTACCAILDQLTATVSQLSDDAYTFPSQTLSGSSVGQHLRHTLEFFVCLEDGFAAGQINYDRRAHDKEIESDRATALRVLDRIKTFVSRQTDDRALVLEVAYGQQSDEAVAIHTNYFRELTYNIEHSVHHMAIMKIGIREVAPQLFIPADFGVAASTLRYRGEVTVEAH